MINHFPLEGSGSGVYTKNLAKELTTRGHKVKVVFPENTKVPSEEFEIRPIFFDGAKKIDYEIDYNFPCFTSHPRSNNTFYRLDDGQIRKYIDTFYKGN